ncbi:hypothetical protein AACH06_14620 [Ideonella sp. DXS29W]|uniref:Uncharacterized protein n=1 Tax=Ideonella lacteola TaxID=2984193 RepID=A0ABU9BT69_9BURK
MHNTMLVSQVAHSAWHAWVLCRALMADLRAARHTPNAEAVSAEVGLPAGGLTEPRAETRECADLHDGA